MLMRLDGLRHRDDARSGILQHPKALFTLRNRPRVPAASPFSPLENLFCIAKIATYLIEN
ncbi:hypothetical protein GR157_30765 [Burkholderia sp. 4701]|nr:hypothetical protein [Burkholderia sp. 4701]MXN86210.1 hypothetical protein [Burkholderia sp. 4812]